MEQILQLLDPPLDLKTPLFARAVLVPFPWMFNGISSLIFTEDPKSFVAKVN